VLVVASLCEVTMPLPDHPPCPPPLRPAWIWPETPLYTPAVAEPTARVVISLLSDRSSFAPPEIETLPTCSTRMPRAC
jgi:hypothetical protein